MPATHFEHPLVPVVAIVGALAITGVLAFGLLGVTHLFHRRPQDHCLLCRRGGE